MLEDAEQEQFRQQLLEMRVKLQQIEQESKHSADTVELDQAKVGRLSRMDALQGQQMALESERRRKLQLQKIEGALRRITEEEFGYCFKCGEDIDKRRLRADPANTKCIKCAD